jgi:hypothetical protein
MATIATRNSGYIALQNPNIMTAKASDQNQVILGCIKQPGFY